MITSRELTEMQLCKSYLKMMLITCFHTDKTCDATIKYIPLEQGSATYGPRAGCGPPRHFTRPPTFHCHTVRDFFFLMIDMLQ